MQAIEIDAAQIRGYANAWKECNQNKDVAKKFSVAERHQTKDVIGSINQPSGLFRYALHSGLDK